jgi:hypothetical protein
VSSLSAAVFVEKLIEREGPIWYRWDRDLAALQNSLVAAVSSLPSASPTEQNEASEFAVRQELILWLLDRLVQKTDSATFENHLNHPRGIYAWGRRLPPETRDELIRFPLPSGPPDNWNRRMVWQALIFAWCDSCPDSSLNSLLNELDLWIPVLSKHESWYLGDPVDEFYSRCTDESVRQQRLAASLQKHLPLLKDQDETARKFADEVALRTWLKLVQSTALLNPAADDVPHREGWDAYFDKVLSQASFSLVAELGRDLIQTHPHLRRMGRSIWIWRHGTNAWEQLYSAVGHFSQNSSYYDRLAEVIPGDRLDIWGGFVTSDFNDDGIRAFCRWLPSKFAEVLRDQFAHPDRDWAACAYQNYLAKTPEPILHHWFRLFDDLPRWQLELLDRRLFAPESVRPSAILEDMQSVEGDLRLQDPFNHRHY